MPILYVDKPKGITSFKLCSIIKDILHVKKIGHTGTLDPNASGLMIILIDEATKANQFLLTDSKEYIGTCKLGILTDTLDIDGKVLLKDCLKLPSKIDLERTMSSFIGKYNQIPPMTSAIKVNGKKLYEYQREGKDVDVKPREVSIFNFDLLDIKDDTFEFKCRVSSGTYVRSLIKDMLDSLSLYGTLIELRRTKIDTIDISSSQGLDDIKNNNANYHSLYEILSSRYNVYVAENIQDVINGKRLKLNGYTDNDILVVDKSNNVLAMYHKENDEYVCTRGLF